MTNIKVVFSDTGEGVPDDIKDDIFEPFFTTKNMGEGCGLGLAICCDIIQRYNGYISLDSTVREGAVFVIRIPLSEIQKQE